MESSSNSKDNPKKMMAIANLFPKLNTVTTWVDLSLKTPVSEHPLGVNMWKGPKYLWNLHETTFIIFFDHSEGKWRGKYLPYWKFKS